MPKDTAECATAGQTLETRWISFRKSPIHGLGGFARLPIPKATRIIEYVGERIDKQESLRRCEADNPYIFALDAQWDLDGSIASNPARFLNHSCAPNCEAEWDGECIWIVALRNIASGEEITFNYGFDLESYHEYPCHCGSPDCVGFIVAEEFFPRLRDRQQQRAAE